MMRYHCIAISAALLLACVSPAVAEDEPLWSLSSSVNYSVGDYGTGKDTTFIYVTLAYTFIGSPAGSTFDNSFGWSVGAAYLVAQPFSVFAFLDGSTAISSGQANPLEVRVGADYRLTQALKIFGSVSRGLSDGSADWGASAGLALRF